MANREEEFMNVQEFNELLERAKDGNPDAQHEIAETYYYGVPPEIEKDLKGAMDWYIKAAHKGNVKSQLILGNAYYDGFGVERDLLRAYFWWDRASRNGDKDAHKKLERLSSYRNAEKQMGENYERKYN